MFTEPKNSFKHFVGTWRTLPLHIQIAVAACFVLASLQLVFIAFHLQAQFLAHATLMVAYFLTAHSVYRFQRSKIENILHAIDSSTMVAKFKPNGEIRAANQLFCDALGYSQKEMIGMAHRKLVPDDVRDSTAYEAFWEKLRRGDSWTGTYERVTKDGKRVWVVGSYTPIRDTRGKVYAVLKIARDVTDQVLDKIELQNKNTYLEHAAKILRHDMHSGINTYIPRGISSLERRLKKCPEIVEKLNLEMPLRLIREGLTHTQKVYIGVKEFTNLVKPGAELEKSSENLKTLLTDYLASTAYRSQVIIDDLPTVEVNGPLFCTAIDNLIRNGLKYNDSPTKTVWIECSDFFEISIKDNGRGLTAKEFEEYSKPYVRKQGQVESGSGLGLNICIAILREHKFTVTCDKRPEGGTCIKIQLLESFKNSGNRPNGGTLIRMRIDD